MTVSRRLSLHCRVEGRQLQMAKAAEEMSSGSAASERNEQNAGQVWIRGKALETCDEIHFLKQL